MKNYNAAIYAYLPSGEMKSNGYEDKDTASGCIGDSKLYDEKVG